MTGEIITLIANVALTLSFVVALVFGIAQVKTAERDRRERLTLETLHAFQTREFVELIYYVIAGKMPASEGEIHTLPMQDRLNFIQLRFHGLLPVKDLR